MSHSTTTVPSWSDLVDDPDNAHLSGLTARLAALDGPADEAGVWPDAIWSLMVRLGTPLWALPPAVGGVSCSRAQLIQRYARVAEGSLTAAFILSQHDAAVRRLAAATTGHHCATGWLEMIRANEAFTTVGLSQLTTSRRLGASPLMAVRDGEGYRLDGAMPWVTGAEMADVIVTGALLDDDRQILVAVPTDRPGLEVNDPFPLAALQASCTSEVVCRNVHVEEAFLLAGPAIEVMNHSNAAGTGGLETSALALGQARAALVALAAEEPKRGDLAEPIDALVASWRSTWDALIATCNGAPDALAPGQVRALANGLVLRATQALLTARRGSGFLLSDPAQRWARQALFFLVWSCPGPVARSTIRELAGICSNE